MLLQPSLVPTPGNMYLCVYTLVYVYIEYTYVYIYTYTHTHTYALTSKNKHMLANKNEHDQVMRVYGTCTHTSLSSSPGLERLFRPPRPLGPPMLLWGFEEASAESRFDMFPRWIY